MRRDCEKLFLKLETPELEGLFGRVISAIEKEKRKREMRTRIGLVFLFAASIIAIPFSLSLLLKQILSSGFAYYISTAMGDLSAFAAYWKDFLLAMAESVPVAGIAVFGINIIGVITVARFIKSKKHKLYNFITL